MEKQTFKVSINADRKKVWNTLWNDKTYREWTSAFSEGSHAETDWKKGSKVFFLNEQKEGMVATIAENRPNEYMSIKHQGTVKNGVEDIYSEESKKWSGGMENYSLIDKDGKTELVVDMDIIDEYKDYFMNTWPKALEKVKEIAEK